MREGVAALEPVDKDSVQTALGDEIATRVEPGLHTALFAEIPDHPCNRICL